MTFASHLFWLNCIRKLSDFDLVYLVKVEFSRVENCLVHLWCMPCCLLQCIELPKDYWCYCISVLLRFSTRKQWNESERNSRFLVTCCVKEKTLVVTKNPQGEGGEKRRFFGCYCLTEKRCKVVIVPREGGKERRRHTHWSMQSGLGTRHNVNILGCCFHIKMPIVKLALSSCFHNVLLSNLGSLSFMYLILFSLEKEKSVTKVTWDGLFCATLPHWDKETDLLFMLTVWLDSTLSPNPTPWHVSVSLAVRQRPLDRGIAAAEDFLPAKSPLFIRESHQV